MPTPTLAAHAPSTVNVHAASAPALVPTVAVRLKPLPLPDWLDEPAASDGLMLLTDDGTHLTGRLATLLATHGATVAVLVLPHVQPGEGASLPPSVERINLKGQTPGHVDAQLAEVVDDLAARHGGIASFVHLSPPACLSATRELCATRDEAMVRQVFLLVRQLQRQLPEQARTRRARFAAVTRLDGQLGTVAKAAQARSPAASTGWSHR